MSLGGKNEPGESGRPEGKGRDSRVSLVELADLPDGPLMGLDPGSRTIGVAVSDGLRLTATALDTIRRRRFAEDAAELARIADHRGITGIIIGLPLNMDGSTGPRAQSARAFARNVAQALGLPVAMFDERLSSFAAKEAMRAASVPQRRQVGRIDSVAAAIILQGALDRLAEIDKSSADE